MGKMRKIVGVSLAVALMTGLVAYVLLPRTGPNSENVVVNQPQTPAPTNGGSGATNSTPTGSGPSTPTPRVRPDKLHGENSHGPKHLVCLPLNSHVDNGVAQYQGANWDRGQCPSGSATVPSDTADWVMGLFTFLAAAVGVSH